MKVRRVCAELNVAETGRGVRNQQASAEARADFCAPITRPLRLPQRTAGVWTSIWTTNHQRLVFSTGTGDLVVVPEPSTYAMALAGLAFGGWRMMRRRRLRQAASLAA